MSGGAISMRNKTSRTLRDVPFKKMKDAVLGTRYELSVAVVGAAESRRITLKTKKKNKVSNVLAFPLAKNSGEIILCPAAAKPFTLPYLFIHGMLHLKGRVHGVTMERIEHKLLRQFGFSAHE